MKRIIVAEALGTAILVATVIGSGIMAERLAGGNVAVALIGNTAATGAVLYVLISLLLPISGAQFNPAVTLLLEKRHSKAAIILAQVAGAIAGAIVAHAMFGEPLLAASTHARATAGEWLGEAVATFGLILTIRLGATYRPDALPALVASWIVAGYWFTSSTSFANPAVTLARTLTDSFSGIRPIDAPAFIAMQLIGAVLGNTVSVWLTKDKTA
ncbi:aquaporin [Sphingobium subterraneum]|uniref:Glycerol uptake facilitator-like aquaporin n=1 Tax=Sphingobium subterraneum TaxID=627688 RepID=A0A841IZK5_9SPHN|nr:aquaporin [Sphingobium subterraneum]MBB6123552.1 glycerol uptake facilitator-like aquaporin [Sphingobium subterraneum]